ncbi:hypothetical protein G5576_016827 [Homo sapiens]|uniref:Uncharacterized protein n=1 Tax=Homo sapiens TaxID=9606 RepID=K7EIL1_HUMAN|nr:hypothetical protein KI723_190217 [Homo sapiens]KAI4039706.1 hypothetical protein G5576_016827 [Homo sapiens]
MSSWSRQRPKRVTLFAARCLKKRRLRSPDPVCGSRTSRTWCSVWWLCPWSGPRAPRSAMFTVQPRTGTRCWAPPAAWLRTACAA